MAVLSGPHAGLSGLVQSMVRSHRMEPFGDAAPSTREETIAVTIREIVRLINRLMAIVEGLQRTEHPEPDEDDFMRGWGEPGGDIES